MVFASAIDQASRAQLQRWGARIETFNFRGKHVANRLARLWPIWKLIFRSSLPAEAKYKLAHIVFHLFYRRHLLYLDFLCKEGGSYERILLTDCRDVFFQADPFGWKQSGGLYVFLEEEATKIGQCAHNGPWIRSLFEGEVFTRLEAKDISCAGTVFGDVSSIIDYLQQMVHTTMRVPTLRAYDGDQGVHNYLVHTDRLPNLTIYSNRRGPVMTVGSMKFSDLRTNPKDQVINEQGDVPPLLHQYDRIPALREVLLAQL